ncbi:MAG TPA: hypothetical protein VF297_32420 [Pyrinomonadaceae bacterium]
MTRNYLRRLAFAPPAESSEDEEAVERYRRAKQRAAAEQIVRDAEETAQRFLKPAPSPPVSFRPPQQEGDLSWGRVIGEALGKVGGAAVGKLTEDSGPPPPDVEPPLPNVTFTPPRPPSEPGPLPTLRPAQTSDQLSDVHEFRPAATAALPTMRPDLVRALVPAGAKPESLPVMRPQREPLPTMRPDLLARATEDPDRLRDDAQRIRRALDARAPADFEPSRLPVMGKAKAGPAPGEEDMNDARVRERIEAAGGYEEGGDVHSRARVARPREFLERRITDIEQNPTRQNSNGRWGGALRSAARAASRILASGGSPAQAVGAFAAGFGLGAADTSLDERLGEMDAADRMRGTLAGMNQREGERLKLEGGRADVRARNAQATYYEQRPDLERDKLTATALERKQKAVQREIGQRLRDPRPFDDNDAYDADLAERAAEVGVNMNRAGFGDAQKPFTIEVLDPTDPQHIRKIRMQYDRATRQWSPAQAGGETFVTNRVQPVGDDGRTPTQRETDNDRDRAFKATQDYRAQMLALSSDRLHEQMLNGLSGRAAREFTTATRGLFERRRAVEKQIEDYSKRAAAYTVDPAEAKRRIGELERERDDITSQIDGSRSSALGSMSSSGSAPAPARPAAQRSRPAGEWGEDPDVRAYADAHFSGDYHAAQMAIEEQRRRRR